MVRIRDAGAEDALAVETVRIETWRTAYRGLLPDAYLDSLTVDAERRAQVMAAGHSTTLLAEIDGDPVGMAVHGPSRDEDREGRYELYALYVDPRRWQCGVGTALLAACRDVTSLWVLEGNARARAFYGRHGFRPDGSTKHELLGDAPAVEVRLVRPGLTG